MLSGWFPYSLAATFFLGTSLAFYKLPSFKKYNPLLSTFWANLVAVFCVCLFFSHELFSQGILPWKAISYMGILWGVLFAMTMMLQKIILQKAETNTIFPLTSSLGSILTILIGVLFLSETLSPLQLLGVAMILVSVYLFTRKNQEFALTPDIVFLSIGIIAVSTASKYVQKFGAGHEAIFSFMLWQYLGASIFSFVIATFFVKDLRKEFRESKKYVTGSILIGIFTFLGGWAIFKALSLGPLSMVYAIHPTYTLITALIGFLLFKENLTRRKMLLILLSIVGVVLIKIG